jgi:hypothetical protein
MTDNKNKECVLYLRNRMGIVKMAALNGVAIIPTFTFNQVRYNNRYVGWSTYPLWWLARSCASVCIVAVADALIVGVNSTLPAIRPLQRAAFNFWIPQWRWLHKLGRRMGFIPLMFSGIWGIPYAMPAPTPLNLVVGKPIVVPKMEGEDRFCAWSGCDA